MNQSLLQSYIRELLFEAFSDGTIRKRTLDFQKEDPSVTDAEAKYYLNRFSDVQGSPYVHEKDIGRYSWRNRKTPTDIDQIGLKDFIDSKWSTRSFYEPISAGDLEPVYQSEDGSLQIFLGDKREKCVTFRKSFEGRTGKNYGWCISRSDASNLFSKYRFRRDEPVFYYIFDFERSDSDPLHACVIYVTKTGKYWLSDANNAEDKAYAWGSLAGMMPKIANLKGVFKHIPATQSEKENLKRLKKELSDEAFASLTRDQKENYISMGHTLSEAKIRNLWGLPDRIDLINKYCNQHKDVFLPLDIWKKLPEATRKVVRENMDPDLQSTYQVHYLQDKKIEESLFTPREFGDIELPEGLEIAGDLELYNRSKNLPANLKVGGILRIRKSTFSELPAGLKCNGLDIRECKNIKKIRDDIFWSRDVKELRLFGSKVVKIPNISVEYLDIGRSKIKKLPEGLQCLILHAFFSNLEELPQGFVADLANLAGCVNLKALPENMKITQDLLLGSTAIEKLPRGLQVGGDIKLTRDTKITSLPLDLKLGGEIVITGYDISRFPFYEDYQKILQMRQAPSKKEAVAESASRLKNFIRNVLKTRDLDRRLNHFVFD